MGSLSLDWSAGIQTTANVNHVQSTWNRSKIWFLQGFSDVLIRPYLINGSHWKKGALDVSVQRMLKFSRLIPSKTHIDYISIQIDYPPVTVPRWSIHNPHLTMRIHAFFLPHTTNIYHHLVVKNPQQNSYLMVKSPSWLSRFLMVKKNQMWYFYLH
jgi:hypothetical protein